MNSTEPDACELDALRRFICAAGHDINNLMTVVSGCCFRLELDPANTAPLHTIERITQDVAQVTGWLSAFGGFPPPRPVLVASVVEKVAASLEGSGIEWGVEASAGPGLVTCDAVLLEQIFRTLFAKALAARSDGGRVGATVRQVLGVGNESGRDWVEVVIKSDGQESAVDATTNGLEPRHGQGGGGIGMTLAKCAVEQLRGSIQMEVGPRHPTSITVRLPATARSGSRAAQDSPGPTPSGVTKV